jgi:hypothetical protein
MSEFVFLFRSTAEQNQAAMGTPEQAQRSMQSFLEWMRELEAGGHLKNPGQPLAPEGKVVKDKGAIVTDGPYAEAKDIVLGYIVVEATDLAHAVELSKKCPMVVGGAMVEVRPVLQVQF